MVRVAVVLSGCGFLDGAEITESVCSLLALDEAGAQIVCCAPDVDQHDVVDHRAGAEVPGTTRNVMVEAARIARGSIQNLVDVDVASIDAAVFPGGYGAAKNLCTFGVDGPQCSVNPDVEQFINAVHDAGKPIGAICIAPALVARVLGARGINVTLTIGEDRATAGAIERMGATHRNCAVTEHVVDEAHRIVSTPAYMLGEGPAEVFEGIQCCIRDVLRLAGK